LFLFPEARQPGTYASRRGAPHPLWRVRRRRAQRKHAARLHLKVRGCRRGGLGPGGATEIGDFAFLFGVLAFLLPLPAIPSALSQMSTPLKRAREEDSRAAEVDPTSPAGETSATTRRPCRRCGRIFSARGLPTHTAACKRKAALAAKVKKPLSAAQIAAFARRKATLARRKAALEEELAERRAAEARAAALRLEAAARLEDWERAERLRLKLRAAQAGEREAEVKAGEEAESKRMNERANVRDKDVFFYLASPS
jgi:hypothetical protein